MSKQPGGRKESLDTYPLVLKPIVISLYFHNSNLLWSENEWAGGSWQRWIQWPITRPVSGLGLNIKQSSSSPPLSESQQDSTWTSCPSRHFSSFSSLTSASSSLPRPETPSLRRTTRRWWGNFYTQRLRTRRNTPTRKRDYSRTFLLSKQKRNDFSTFASWERRT